MSKYSDEGGGADGGLGVSREHCQPTGFKVENFLPLSLMLCLK